MTRAMFFDLSKLLAVFVGPGNLLLIALIVGAALLWARARRAGRIVVTLSVAGFLLIAVFPIGKFMLVPLENRFPPATLPAKIDGIVVLGGEVNQRLSAARHIPILKGSAGRMTAFVALARRYPGAKLAFTGGSALLGRPDLTEAPVARAFFASQGLDTARIAFEDHSRNTWENAVDTKALMHPAPGETWLLITSADHMARAYGCFSRVGWKVVPYPVDYLTDGSYDFAPGFALAGGLARLDLALHEWVGLVVYRLMGYTDALFPAPPPTPAAGRAD